MGVSSEIVRQRIMRERNRVGEPWKTMEKMGFHLEVIADGASDSATLLVRDSSGKTWARIPVRLVSSEDEG